MDDVATLRCSACGTMNRVRADRRRAGTRPVCGRCRAPLAAGGVPLTVTDASFAADVERSPLPVLLDAWAAWCAPCRAVAPIIAELAAEWEGRVRVAKVDVDQNPAIAARFALRSIPTLLVFAGGREVDRLVGAHPKEAIVRRLERVLG